MSFGYSVGDVLLLAEKLHDLCIALNDSRRNAPRQIQLLAAEFGRYGDRLQDLHQTLLRYGQAPNSGSVSFEDTLKECDEFLAKYSPLSDSGSNKIKWLYRVATWTTEEKTIQRLRDQVAGHVHDIGMDSNNLMIASVLEILKILKGPSSLAPQERSLATISEEAYEPPTPSLAAIENTKRSNLLLDQMPQTGGLNRQGPREIAGPRARNLLQAAPSQDDNILTPMALPSALGISGLSPQYDLSGRTFERAKYNLKRRTNIAIQRNETPPASGGPASSPTFLAQASRVHTLPDDYESDQSVQIQSDVEKLMKRLSCASATSRASLEQEELSRISEEANKLLERSQYSKKRSSIASIRIQDVDFSLPVSTRSRINLKRRARIICPQISMKELVCDLELSKTPEGVTESIYMIVNNGSHLIQHGRLLFGPLGST
ncbi:MAG: hypothetical protein M1829_005023 [Trizodia sp. TS-e1964]|nr:MAG: hypothetical protein M1829_005023 [Trizodia sp. TS-e1964]